MFTTVQTEDAFQAMLDELLDSPVLAFDLETRSLRSGKGEIVGWAFANEPAQGQFKSPGRAWYIPVGHSEGEQLEYDWVVQRLTPVFADRERLLLAHNAKFDTRFLLHEGISFHRDSIHDTMLEAFCTGRHFRKGIGLKSLTSELFLATQVEFKELFPPRTKKANLTIANLAIDLAAPYACDDAAWTLRLHNWTCERSWGDPARRGITRLEHRLWPVVQQIEDRGVRVDQEMAEALAENLDFEATRTRELIYWQFAQAAPALAPRPNLGSPVQLAQVLFDVLGATVQERSPTTGQPSTSEVVLTKLVRQGFPVCHNILQYRSINDGAETVRATVLKHMREDGRIHTSYNQAGAGTGRFSSSEPNLQNVSTAKKWTIWLPHGERYVIERALRECLIAADDHYLIELDFAAIEFLLLGAFAGEAKIVNTYLAGGDLHRQTASLVLRKPPEEVTKDERDAAKTTNYSIAYGAAASTLAERDDSLTPEQWQEYIDGFLREHEAIANWIAREADAAQARHAIETAFGRYYEIAAFRGFEEYELARGRRQAINAIIQGSAADIHKMGLIRAHALEPQFPGAHLILQTHDSQTWEVPCRIRPQDIIPAIMEAMSPPTHLPRIRVDAKLGYSWGLMEGYQPEVDYVTRYPVWLERRAEHVEALKRDIVAVVPDAVTADAAASLSYVPTRERWRFTIRLNRLDPAELQRFKWQLSGDMAGLNEVTVIGPGGASAVIAHTLLGPSSVGLVVRTFFGDGATFESESVSEPTETPEVLLQPLA